MRLFLQGLLPKEINTLFGELGYIFDKKTGDASEFKRRLHDRKFPRYHLFVHERADGIELDLHIDQEHPYGRGNHQEEWAYRGAIVQKELSRIESVIERMKRAPVVLQLKPKKTFWRILIGR